MPFNFQQRQLRSASYTALNQSSSQQVSRNFGYLCLLFSLSLIGWIGNWSHLIKDGNTLYQSGDYDAAIAAYQSAVKRRPNQAISHYNLGAAYYQNGQFQEAANAFRQSLNAKDPILRAQGYYNLGNTQVQLGNLQEAIQSYKSALRLNPMDQETKYNLELALEKAAQRQPQPEKQSDSGQHHRQEQNAENPAQQGQKNRDSSARAESPSSATQPPSEMSREEAIRLLKAIKENEKETQKKLLRQRFTRRQRPEKDW